MEGAARKRRSEERLRAANVADLTYRLHWAVRAARLGRRRIPRGVDPDVVEERHYTLNWLIGRHASSDWDDVDTPT